MRDRAIIFAGLALFLTVVLLPFWRTASPGLVVRMPATERKCVESVESMRASHMQLLNTWRRTAVREGAKTYIASDGRRFAISLNKTCLEQCHGNRTEFCDRCHANVGVSAINCWSCHGESSKANAVASAAGGRP